MAGTGDDDVSALPSAEFHAAGFVELLCEESRNAACDSAARALHLASCAAAAASAVPGDAGWRPRSARRGTWNQRPMRFSSPAEDYEKPATTVPPFSYRI
jgi:hypothetical protein